MSKKYGRTYHLPWSLGVSDDDKVMKDLSTLEGAEVVITEKLDGENTTIHCQGTHARSTDSKFHPSRSWMRAYAAQISGNLGENERIVGEYLYARHSIQYDELDTYFYGFAWIVDGVFQDWDLTVARFEELGIQTVPVLYRGVFDVKTAQDIAKNLDFNRQEGYVVRTVQEYSELQMPLHMGKFVRRNHVQTNQHWMFAEIVKNKLKE